MLPFTPEQFVQLFADYNRAVWPAQVIAYLLGLGIVIALFRSSARSERLIGFGLALMWAWTGIAYHWMHFFSIWSGHPYPGMPMFGITPCPVTLFTVGVILLATTAPWWLLVIPFAWSLIGASAAFLLAMPQDWPLLVSGVAILLSLRQRRGSGHPKRETSLRP